MAITNLDGLVTGLLNRINVPFAKANTASTVAGSECSLWRATGYPAQAAIPTTAAVCSASLLGAFPLSAKIAGQDRAIAQIALSTPTAGNTLIIEDRLMHLGGLVGNITTAQTAVVDISANLGVNNIAERIGNPSYSELAWYLEWYTTTGSTAATPTINVTFTDDTTANLNIWVAGSTALPASVAASRRYRIYNNTGKIIKRVNSVTFSASTGTAGNFGITVVRQMAYVNCTLANQMLVYDWSLLGLPKVFDEACITISQLCVTTTSGAIQGNLLQAVG